MQPNLFRKKYQLYWLTLFVSMILFIPVFILFPEFSEYEFKLVSTEKSNPQNVILFNDLNFDGTNEKLIFDLDFLGTPALLVETKGKILYQFNLTGKFVSNNFYHIDDLNGDKQKEICVLTHENDSVFLHILNGITEEIIVNRLFISTYERNAGTPDFQINFSYSEDLNNDGYKELILPMVCGFTYVNRKVCVYNLKENKLYQSPISGVTLFDEVFFQDINNDNRKEIMGTISAYGNTAPDYSYSDQICWLQVLNNNANYIFKPVNVGIYPSNLYTCPVLKNGKWYVAVFYKYLGSRNHSSYIALYDYTGTQINKRIIPYKENLRNHVLFLSYPSKNPEQLILYREDGSIEFFDSNLKLLSSKNVAPFSKKIKSVNLDEDNENEHILYNEYSENLIIARNDFSSPIAMNIGELSANYHISKVDAKNHLFALKNNNVLFTFSYRQNFVYPFRYLVLALIWFGIFIFVYIIGYTFQFIAKRRYEAERNVAQMQLAAIENQLNPHFNLNILNSIGALYETQEKEKAQYYFGKYNKLLRQLLFQSGYLTVSVLEELKFVKNYLELEKLRMNNSFDFEVRGDENLLDMEIPKMLIHNFTENAVKHGLKNSQKKGLIKIEFFRQKNTLEITVCDNGIGREKAKQYSLMSTGKGMEIVNKSLKLYLELKNKRINYNITDLYNEAGNAAGTKVEISVPV